MNIEMDDIVKLCRVDEQSQDNPVRKERALNGGWTAWLSIRDKGVYYLLPGDDDDARNSVALDELKLALDVTDDAELGEPVLHFPCDEDAFWRFLDDQGLSGCVVPTDWSDWLEAKRTITGKRELQEQAILKALKEMGVDPKAIRHGRRNDKGPKSIIQDKLEASRKDLFGGTRFDHAWDRLGKKRLIHTISDER